MISPTCKRILNYLYRLSPVPYWRERTAQMRPQGLPTTIASHDGRAWSLVRQCCTIEGYIFFEVVEIGTRGIALEGLSRSAVRKYDIMAFQLDVQVFDNSPARWLPSGNAAPVDEITYGNQKTIYKEAMSLGHVKVAVRHVTTERTACDLDWKNRLVP